VPGGVQLLNKGRSSILGGTPLPTTSGCQPKSTSGIHHKPAAVPIGGQTMEGRGYSKHPPNARSWKPAGGKSTHSGRNNGCSTVRTGGQIAKVHRTVTGARQQRLITAKGHSGLRCYQQRIAIQDITPGKIS
jgi:hypothetical protein